jgi:hypothetical protein
VSDNPVNRPSPHEMVNLAQVPTIIVNKCYVGAANNFVRICFAEQSSPEGLPIPRASVMLIHSDAVGFRDALSRSIEEAEAAYRLREEMPGP